jgi:hypothetical protein
MQLRQTTYLLVGAFLLPVTACTVARAENAPVSNRFNSGLNAPAIDARMFVSLDAQEIVAQRRPETLTTTVSVEGEPTEVELQLFDEAGMPFTTYVPAEEFTEDVAASGEGEGVRFYFSPTGTPDEQAYLHIFFPTDAPDAEAMSELLMGEEGLLTTNGWQVVDRTNSVRFPWAEERIVYEQPTPQGTYMGSIFVGEHEGKSFIAFTHYPVEYGDGFEPRAEVILENLELR